jgi:hypothetical protein
MFKKAGLKSTQFREAQSQIMKQQVIAYYGMESKDLKEYKSLFDVKNYGIVTNLLSFVKDGALSMQDIESDLDGFLEGTDFSAKKAKLVLSDIKRLNLSLLKQRMETYYHFQKNQLDEFKVLFDETRYHGTMEMLRDFQENGMTLDQISDKSNDYLSSSFTAADIKTTLKELALLDQMVKQQWSRHGFKPSKSFRTFVPFYQQPVVISKLVNQPEIYKTTSPTEDSFQWIMNYASGFMTNSIHEVAGVAGANTSRAVVTDQRGGRWFPSTSVFSFYSTFMNIYQHRQMKTWRTAFETLNTLSFAYSNLAAVLLKVNLPLVVAGVYAPFFFASNSMLAGMVGFSMLHYLFVMNTEKQARMVAGITAHQVYTSRAIEYQLGVFKSLQEALSRGGLKPEFAGQKVSAVFNRILGPMFGRLTPAKFNITFERPDAERDLTLGDGFSGPAFFSGVMSVSFAIVAINLIKSIMATSMIGFAGWGVLAFWVGVELNRALQTMHLNRAGAPLLQSGEKDKYNELWDKLFGITENRSPYQSLSSDQITAPGADFDRLPPRTEGPVEDQSEAVNEEKPKPLGIAI